MISEERVKLMTRMASFEAKQGQKNTSVAKYFRNDYVGLQALKAVICATIAYMIVFAAYIYYDLEFYLLNIYKMDVMAFAKTALKYYIVVIVVYSVIVYLSSVIKYNLAKKKLKRYFNNLKKLNALYSMEARIEYEAGKRE